MFTIFPQPSPTDSKMSSINSSSSTGVCGDAARQLTYSDDAVHEFLSSTAGVADAVDVDMSCLEAQVDLLESLATHKRIKHSSEVREFLLSVVRHAVGDSTYIIPADAADRIVAALLTYILVSGQAAPGGPLISKKSREFKEHALLCILAILRMGSLGETQIRAVFDAYGCGHPTRPRTAHGGALFFCETKKLCFCASVVFVFAN